MAIRVSPSIRTTKAYCSRTDNVARTDIAIIVNSLLVLIFGVGCAATNIVTGGVNIEPYSVANLVANILTPVLAITVSSLSIYLYAYRCLSPLTILLFGLVMTSIWVVTFYIWIMVNWRWPNLDPYYSSTVSLGLMAPKLIFGLTTTFITLVHTIKAGIALHQCHHQPAATQSEAGYIESPIYDNLSTQEPPKFAATVPERKIPLSNKCCCVNCS